jgi:hypothetical protein
MIGSLCTTTFIKLPTTRPIKLKKIVKIVEFFGKNIANAEAAGKPVCESKQPNQVSICGDLKVSQACNSAYQLPIPGEDLATFCIWYDKDTKVGPVTFKKGCSGSGGACNYSAK